MSVGLYDVDFARFHQMMFNLELMKLATYYKSKKEITVLSPTYSPEKYSSFFLRKDYYDGTFPKNLSKYPNLDYGGLAFTNQVYVPMEEEIESQKSDTFIYEKQKNLFVGRLKGNENCYRNLVLNNHLRLSLDGKTIWKNFEKQLSKDKKSRTIFFHDLGLGDIENDKEIVSYVLNEYSVYSAQPASLGVKHPIKCTSTADIAFWSQFCSNLYFFSIDMTKPLCDEEFVELILKEKKSKLSKINYNVVPDGCTPDDFIVKQLPKIFKQAIFCCMNQKKILLTISNDFPISDEWRKVITLFNVYITMSARHKETLTLHRVCKYFRPRTSRYKGLVLDREDAREIFYFVMENNYELFKLFYECNNVVLKGGELICQKLEKK